MNLINLFIQENLTGELMQEAVKEGVTKLNFIDLAMKGGWIMIPIVLLSLVAISIFITKYFEINTASKPAPELMDGVKELIEKEDLNGALSLCRSNSHPMARMVHKGLVYMGRPMSDIKEALENVGNQEIFILEKGLSSIAMVASAAPMLGFLGTVMGMIDAFYQMSNAGANVDITLLSGGIYTAMVTTVAGLIVGLIGYFCYNILTAKVKKVVYNMEQVTGEFMDILVKPIN